jgi:hypothetical protein
VYIYVAFRSNRPDKATMHHVKKELEKNNVEFSQLVVWPACHCQHAESSKEE